LLYFINAQECSFLVSTTAILLAGCGGSGSGVTNSPFAGRWVGTYTTDTGNNGTADITVASSGAVTGSGRNISLAVNFNLAGSINNSGNITGTVSGGLSGTLNGTLTISGVTGHLTGTVIQRISGTDIACTFDLTRS
jgi:hypothetical protein